MKDLATGNHQYTTTDTALATYLIVEGFILDKIDFSQPRFEFTFKNASADIQEHATKYITGKALVDPAAFTRVNRKLQRCIRKQLQWGVE